VQVVLNCSHDQDHADRNGECRSNNASGDALGSNSSVARLNASCVSNGVVQVEIQSEVVFQGNGVVNVHTADMTMY
jgi:hypothetical protein